MRMVHGEMLGVSFQTGRTDAMRTNLIVETSEFGEIDTIPHGGSLVFDSGLSLRHQLCFNYPCVVVGIDQTCSPDRETPATPPISDANARERGAKNSIRG